MSHPVSCRCGAVKGELSAGGTHNRLICYCKDCRAFARYLAETPDILDTQGGTEIIQLAQARLRFTQGEDQLAAVRLSDKGLIRWYAGCCRTPIGNTLPNAKLSFIGMIHSCLDKGRLTQDFGESVALVHTQSALGEPKPEQRGFLRVGLKMAWILLSNWLGGGYRRSVLFDGVGRPLVEPNILEAKVVAGLKKAD